jgi:tRNA/rRNA methyltransferase
MLPPQHRDRLVVVLVRARNPNNIGAVARAMRDFGFARLRVVNDYPVPFQSAKSAVDASQVLAEAAEFLSLAEALSDCTLVLGTTAVGDRVLDHPLHELPQTAPLIRAELAAPEGRVALLFGSEKTGLSNDELSHCHALLTIPMHARHGERHPSMNLGQAAAVCLYEIVREASTAPATPPLSPAEDLQRLDGLLATVLDRTGYRRRHPANADPATLRRLTRRMALTPADAAVWMGILRQLLWKLDNPTPDQPS